MKHAAGAPRPQRVWDWPVRLFHWLLVLAVIAMFVTGKLGGNWMEWHKRTGFFVIGLIAFRFIWGFVGSHHARFVNFLRGPKTIMSFLRGTSGESAGHNPLGALSVVAMLLAIAFQAGSGLFANDDIMLEGPYAVAVGKEMSDFITRLHKLNSRFILVLVGVHLAVVAFYFFGKKTDLIKPMFTGRKIWADELPAVVHRPWLAPAIVALVGLAVYLLVNK